MLSGKAYLLLSCLIWITLGSPIGLKNGNLVDRSAQQHRQVLDYLKHQRNKLKIIQTTTSPNGQLIDWIPLHSQGPIAKPPPLPVVGLLSGFTTSPVSSQQNGQPLAELELEGAVKGPAGTVPVARHDLNLIPVNTTLTQLLTKAPEPESESDISKRQSSNAGAHW